MDVVRRAFTGDDRDGGDEVEIVRKTWELEASPPGLELVATDVGRVIGHVLGATADIGDTTVVAVAPLSVVPDRQGEGIGTDLMTTLIDRTDRAGWPMIVLLGNPAYYSRFD